MRKMENNEQRVFKNNGKRFEEDFKASLGEKVWAYRPSDTGGGLMSRFTSESLADLFAFNIETKVLSIIELKSTLGTSVSFKPYMQCMDYEKKKKQLDEWNSKQTPMSRKKLKDEIKDKKKYIKGLYKETNQAMIKYHQIKSLMDIENKYDGEIKTYIAITFFKSNETYMITTKGFHEFWKTTNKKSINREDIIKMIPSKKAYKIEQEYIRKTMKSKYKLGSLLG